MKIDVDAVVRKPGLRYLDPVTPQLLGRARFWVGTFAAIYLAIRVPHMLTSIDADPARFDPVGYCAGLPRTLHPATVWLQSLAAPLLAAAFALGWRYRFTGPLAAFVVGWVLSYRNSFGMVFHTENLLMVHMALLAFAPAADAWSLDARRRGTPMPAPAARYGWPLRLLAVVTVTVYLIAGLAKLRYEGWDLAWMSGELLRAHVAFDNLRKEALDHIVAPFGPWLVRQAWAFGPLALATMLLEVGAPFALFHRRAALVWVVGIWGFHLGVLLTMAILFPYPLSGVAFVGIVRNDAIWRWGPLKRFAARYLAAQLGAAADPRAASAQSPAEDA